ncbi:MAG: bifunctional pyr operon transcriptional regulator/uracil phosphoribosyltransferase PyrR [Planctomycetes bacterium]|nr:bifunctional pyr operon transcriptional regulator/uracil phosphoribosyltransferase PyrR [Planctomycetota bacterium]
MNRRVLYDRAATGTALEGFFGRVLDFVRNLHEHDPDRSVHVVGIRSRGDTLARRLDSWLRAAGIEPGVPGVLDITLYRDDFVPGRPQPLVSPSDIPFEVEGATILLIDDVFQTGRTIRAALNQLSDFGRPRSVTLAVFIDRRMRELPICPDIVGLTIELPPDERLQLLLDEDDGDEAITAVAREGGA